jgi:mRNA interferase RelE/StbE
MSLYNIIFKKSVEKDLRSIDRIQIPKILSAIESLSDNPIPIGSRKLVGSDKTYRIRIGDYRVIYIIEHDSSSITIQRIAHRKEAYE